MIHAFITSLKPWTQYAVYVQTLTISKAIEGAISKVIYFRTAAEGTVKPVLVATSIKQATCIKQACSQFPRQENTWKCTCIKQAPVLSKHILFIP